MTNESNSEHSAAYSLENH